jgi:hypothetical protein
MNLYTVEVNEDDVFGVERRLCLVVCPICDKSGFIQEDVQCITGGSTYNIFYCAIKHVYRIRIK